ARNRFGELPGICCLLEVARSWNAGRNAAESRTRDALNSRAGTVEQVKDGERNVAALPFERLRGKVTRGFGRLRAGTMAGEAAQAVELPSRDDEPGVLGSRAENAARMAVIVRQRGERKSSVGFLE